MPFMIPFNLTNLAPFCCKFAISWQHPATAATASCACPCRNAQLRRVVFRLPREWESENDAERERLSSRNLTVLTVGNQSNAANRVKSFL